ncbi:MAG: class I SAM-dependent methyltransferase [Janthinobacterium lividum]
MESSAELIPFATETFDAVVGGYVLNHLPRPEVALAELRRVLVPGGRLALTIWDLPSAKPAIGLFGPVVQDLGLTAGVPAGPDAYMFCDLSRTHLLLTGWDEVRLSRAHWTALVRPGDWFDAVADSTPRTGAVLAQAAALPLILGTAARRREGAARPKIK